MSKFFCIQFQCLHFHVYVCRIWMSTFRRLCMYVSTFWMPTFRRLCMYVCMYNLNVYISTSMHECTIRRSTFRCLCMYVQLEGLHFDGRWFWCRRKNVAPSFRLRIGEGVAARLVQSTFRPRSTETTHLTVRPVHFCWSQNMAKYMQNITEIEIPTYICTIGR
jgi:hypothetical protein